MYIFVYGSEAWLLDEQACKCINGANAYMLSHITGKTKQEEATAATTSFNIIAWIRSRRLKWVGHILRIPDNEKRLIKTTLKHIYNSQQPGDILMDLPAHLKSWEDMQKFTEDRVRWRSLVRRLKMEAKRCTLTTRARRKRQRKPEIKKNGIASKFSFLPSPPPSRNEDEPSIDVTPFSIASGQQRVNALKAASSNNVTYTFEPRKPE